MPDTRHLPAQTPRVETGPVKFGDDWTGLFIRGDNAMYYALCIRSLIEQVEKPLPFEAGVLRMLERRLREVDEHA